MKPLLFVTSSKDKLQEAQIILEVPIESISIPDLHEIQGTPEQIITKKTLDAFTKIGKPLFTDDTSFVIHAWDNLPGSYIKAFSNNVILNMMRHEENRLATATMHIGYHDGRKVHVFTASIRGEVTREERGDRPFGWTPIFIPEGHTRTMSEMSVEEQAAVSPRKIALLKLKKYLTKH